MTLTAYQHEILSFIAQGRLIDHLCSIVSYKKKRLMYYTNIQKLKDLGIVIEFLGELTINTSNKYYKFQNYNNANDQSIKK